MSVIVQASTIHCDVSCIRLFARPGVFVFQDVCLRIAASTFEFWRLYTLQMLSPRALPLELSDYTPWEP